MGGAVISSIRAGRGDEASSRRAVGNTLLMLVVASLPLMAVLLMFGAPLSELLGGRGATLAEAVNYIMVIAWGTPFLVLQVGCLPLIRNRGHVNYAMGVSVLSGLVNVCLLYTSRRGGGRKPALRHGTHDGAHDLSLIHI